MTITKEEEIKPHLGHDRPVVVGHFKTNKNLKYKYFSEVINQIDEVDAMCSFGDAEVEEPMDSFTVYNANGRPFVLIMAVKVLLDAFVSLSDLLNFVFLTL